MLVHQRVTFIQIAFSLAMFDDPRADLPSAPDQVDPTPRFAIAISSLTLVRHRQVGW